MLDLCQPCENRGIKKPHTCMDPFKENLAVVKNWRALWRSLPASLRQEALLMKAREKLAAKNAKVNVRSQPQVSYTFLGHPVCKNALMRLSRIGAWSLDQAKKRAASGHKSCSSRPDLGNAILIQNTNQPKKYLDARNWLVHYADTHAEKSPISLESYLPAGRKSFYHAAYEHDRKKAGRTFAVLSVFLAAWRCECPWLVVMKSVSKFVKCNLCEFLKRQIDITPRNETLIMGILKDRSPSSSLGPYIAVPSAIDDRSCHPVAFCRNVHNFLTFAGDQGSLW